MVQAKAGNEIKAERKGCLMIQVQRPIQTYDALMGNQDKLRDPVWLEQFLFQHCKVKTYRRRGSRLRIIQYPWEFARFLVLLAEQNVKSYLEVGTSTGGSFLMVDSYLRAAVPGYERSVGYDHRDRIRDFQDYKARFPTCEFRHQSSATMDVSSERFDAAFIDARHVERWVLQDYEKVTQAKPRVVAFHDIRLNGATVAPAWDKIRINHPVSIDLIDPSVPQPIQWGIGVAIGERQ